MEPRKPPEYKPPRGFTAVVELVELATVTVCVPAWLAATALVLLAGAGGVAALERMQRAKYGRN